MFMSSVAERQIVDLMDRNGIKWQRFSIVSPALAAGVLYRAAWDGYYRVPSQQARDVRLKLGDTAWGQLLDVFANDGEE